jgi:CheY-like chemotaxis protein
VATILVADDNSNIQKMVTLAMKDQGIDVVAVGNGEAAIRKLPDVLPDIVLADIFMPVRNGYEVCEYIKHDARYAHIPVILMVGAFDPLDEREAERVGAYGVLKKPFVPPEPLIRMVKSVLEKSASERLVPVTAGVAPATEKASRTLSGTPNEPAVPPPEVLQEDFAPHTARVDFGESERPLAFSQLFEAPAAEPVPAPEVVSHPDTGLGDMHFWHSPPATDETQSNVEGPAWGDARIALPRREDAALLRPFDYGADEPEETAPDQQASASHVVETAAEEVHSAFPEEHFEGPPPETEPVHSASEERLTPAVPTHSARDSGEALSPGVFIEEVPARMTPIPGVTATPPRSSFETQYRSPEASEPAAPAVMSHTDTVQSFGVPQPVNSELVEAVVARVLERMQPQILDIVTREILKPVVEALVRRELEKN